MKRASIVIHMDFILLYFYVVNQHSERAMTQFDLATLIWVALGLAALAWLVGGFLSPVAGHWRDRDRMVELRQLGPWVWGKCEIPGGVQRYQGKIWLGALILERRDFGKQYLLQLGFNAVQVKSVEGQVMVRLKLHRDGDCLRGNQWGTRFKFNPRTQAVLSVQPTAAETREWVKL